MHGRFVEFALHINRPENDRRIQIFTFLTCTRSPCRISRTQVSCITIHGHCLKVFFFFENTRKCIAISGGTLPVLFMCTTKRGGIQDKRY